MFIKAHDRNGNDEILINTNHVKRCRTVWLRTKETYKTYFYGADDEAIGERESKNDQELIDRLTTTLVPVAGAGYTMVYIRTKEDGYDEPTIEETPIIAFRVYDGYGVPLPVIVDESNDDIMNTPGQWGIKMPNGRVLVPYTREYESPEAFLADIVKKIEKVA